MGRVPKSHNLKFPKELRQGVVILRRASVVVIAMGIFINRFGSLAASNSRLPIAKGISVSALPWL